jgi:hypothetical protein
MKTFFFGASISLAILSLFVFFRHQLPFNNLSASIGLLGAFLFFALGLLCHLLEPAKSNPPESEG